MSSISRAAKLGVTGLLYVFATSATAQSPASSTRLSTSGACSPAIVNNSGSITINCGADNAEIARALNELLQNNSKEAILESLQGIRRDLARLKKETSNDPRKEVANVGSHWREEDFGRALLRGDTRLLKLFLAGKDKGLLYSKYEGEYALARLISAAHRIDKFQEIFQLLLDHGLDVDFEFEPGPSQLSTLAEHAVAARNPEAFQLIWRKSKRQAALRDAVRKQLADEQENQRRAHARSQRASTEEARRLLLIALTTEPESTFSLSGHEVRYDTGASGRASPGSRLYDGPDGWFILLETTSLVQRVTYEIAGNRRTVERTTRLPVDLEEFSSPRTPVHIEATDALGRTLGPVSIIVDREDLRSP